MRHRKKIWKSRIILCTTIIFCILIGSVIPTVSAHNDSMKVIVTVDSSKQYAVGDTVTCYVYVFDKGAYVNADGNPLIILNKYYENQRNSTNPIDGITVNKIGTGKYEVTFSILESDCNWYDSYCSISIYASATYGKSSVTDDIYNSDYDSKYISITTAEVETGLSITVTIDNYFEIYPFEPGDTVDLTATVRYDDIKVTPDEFEVKVGYGEEDWEGGYENEDYVSCTNPSVGIYEGSYAIPSVTESTTFLVEAFASYGGVDDTYNTGFSVDFFAVYYHELSVTKTQADFEIYVSDLNGNVIPSAVVSFSYDNDDDWNTPEVSVQETTDATGKASFTITYTNVSDISDYAYANASGKSQIFDIYIATPYEDISTYGLSVIDRTEDGTVESGQFVTKQYQAYMEGAELSNADIYYYAYNSTSIISYGKRTTDSQGKFTLSFTVYDIIYIVFEAENGEHGLMYDWDTGTYHDSNDGFQYDDSDTRYIYVSTYIMEYIYFGHYFDANVSISIEPLKIGEKTNITVSMPDSLGYIASVWCEVGGPGESIMGKSKWKSCAYGIGAILQRSDDIFTGSIIIPEFMPKDSNYTIIANVFDPTTYDYHLNYITVKPDNDGDGCPDVDDAFPSDATQWLDTDGDSYGDNPTGNNPDAFPNNSEEWLDYDGDGYGDNKADAFISDPAASKDTDKDGYPDEWNTGKNQDDSTAGLTLDAFPTDPAASKDSDGDGYPDGWNTGKTQVDSITGLTLDAFPNDASEWKDSDSDGTGDNSDAFPTDAKEWKDSDSDGHGDNSDVFPHDSSEWVDSDGDGFGDNSDFLVNLNNYLFFGLIALVIVVICGIGAGAKAKHKRTLKRRVSEEISSLEQRIARDKEYGIDTAASEKLLQEAKMMRERFKHER